MAVNFVPYADVDFSRIDAVIVGSGFAGSVVARELAERGGMRVHIIEKRSHVGGNMYDCVDDAGILVHAYGPHIFHTNSQQAYDYLARFTNWRTYQHEVLANWHGTYIPVPFNKNSMEIVFGPEKALRLIDKLVQTFGDERKVTITELRAQEDPELQEVRRIRVPQRIPVLHSKTMGSHSRRGKSVCHCPRAGVHLPRQPVFPRCLPGHAGGGLYGSVHEYAGPSPHLRFP